MSDWETSKNSLYNMKFPEKLWNIVNECVTGSIGWGLIGDTITLEYSKFQEEYLSKDTGVFKTCNIASFVRQLNLYGFRKCNRHSEELHEFKHALFVKDRKDLLGYIRRKPGSQIYSNSYIRTPKSSKIKSFSQAQICKETIKSPESSTNKARRPETKKTPLRERRNSNENNLVENLWWNNLPFTPYPTNVFQARNMVPHGWVPADAAFYNSQQRTKQEPEEYHGEENYYRDNNPEVYENCPPTANSNAANMYFLVMPGYIPPHNHSLYSNNGFYNGLHPLSGMPLAFPTDKKMSDTCPGRMYGEDFNNSNALQ